MPVVRSGIAGIWDRIVGPGMGVAEASLVLGCGGIGALLATARLAQSQHSLLALAFGAAMAFDVIAGAVCNATLTTKRWYGRRGQDWRHRAFFVAPHALYIALIAWRLRGAGFDAGYFVVFSSALIIGTACILAVPDDLKAPTAFAATIMALMAILLTVGLTPYLEWFAPALLLKLLVGHLAASS